MRPWPVPNRPWVMRMRWRNLLFAHWVADAAALRKLIPAGLELDLFDGNAYLGVVPFLMEGVTAHGAPAIPGLHAFPELNLRTYVTAGGKPGVWFFSLDAGQKLAVRVARRFFHLPYFDAKFHIVDWGEEITYSATRTHPNAAHAALAANYGPVGDPYHPEPGSLDDWLTSRYCLYSADHAGSIYRGDIDHDPWPLQHARAEFRTNTLGDWLGIPILGRPATLHFSKSLDVHAWLIKGI